MQLSRLVSGAFTASPTCHTRVSVVPLRARLNGHPVVAGLPVPTDDLVPVAGGPSWLPLRPSSTPLTLP